MDKTHNEQENGQARNEAADARAAAASESGPTPVALRRLAAQCQDPEAAHAARVPAFLV